MTSTLFMHPAARSLLPTVIPILPPNLPFNSRNSEGDFIELKDGSLLFVYSHFVGDNHNDHEPAFLAGRRSFDQGITWADEDEVILPNEAGMNVMSVTLLRTLRGDLALFYLRKNSEEDCRVHRVVSRDEGKSWSEPVLCIPEEGYYPTVNDRVIRLSSGRLLLPTSRHSSGIHPNGEWGVFDRAVSMAFYSDDDGETWTRSLDILEGPEDSISGLQEPGVIELKDGRVMMWMRTDQGCQYQSFSEDEGQTWSKACPSNIISPLSPASIKRVPQTQDLLLIWNDHRNIDEARRGKRTPLCAAISKDEGRSWGPSQVIEDYNRNGFYCYTAIEFFGDRVYLGYCAGAQTPVGGGTSQTNFAHFSYRWLYPEGCL